MEFIHSILMSKTQPDTFDTTVQKTNTLLKAIEERFGWSDRDHAYAALRAVLQTLRDRLTQEHVAGLGAQLPMLVRGIYYEGWKPSDAPIKMNREEFVGEVNRLLGPLSHSESTEEIIKGVVAIIQDYTDPNEMRKIKNTLPADIKDMLGSP
jgi:uncharacterized protein (DUF2267 family)